MSLIETRDSGREKWPLRRTLTKNVVTTFSDFSSNPLTSLDRTPDFAQVGLAREIIGDDAVGGVCA